MDFFEAVKTRRSVRWFTPGDVPQEDVLKLLEAARAAPSATNQQPWHFIVVRDQGFKNELQGVVNAVLDSRLDAAAENPFYANIKQLRPFAQQFAAPVAIAVLAKLEEPPSHFSPALQSVAAAIAQLCLAATALGYGSCWATAPVVFAAEELEAMLGVKRPWRLVAVIAVGKPVGRPVAPARKPLSEITTFIG